MVSLYTNTYDPNKIQSLEIGDIAIDVTRSEGHSFKNDVPKFPVENGFNITDNVKQQNPVLTITGLSSNTPVFFNKIAQGVFDGTEKLIRENYTNRVQQTFNFLLTCAGYTPTKQATGEILQKVNKPKILVIVTGLMIYRDMIITSLDIPRHSKSGDGLEFNITFEQITIVNSKYETRPVVAGKAPNTKLKMQEKKDTGKKQAKEPDTSVLNDIVDSLKNWSNTPK